MPNKLHPDRSILSGYATDGFYDELFETNGSLREFAAPLRPLIERLTLSQLRKKQKAAEYAFLQQGITFSVYGSRQGVEKVFPVDILPRIIPAEEWARLEAGLKQRVDALNLFVDDIYHEQKILRDGAVPKDLVLSSPAYLEQCRGIKPPGGIWIHISGIDLVRDVDGTMFVLEDNLRCPSGISYVLENRNIQKLIFPQALSAFKVRPVSAYCDQLYRTLSYLGKRAVNEPNVVVLTPGPYNSAYFEHAYLAQHMGVPLVEGRDLAVIDDQVMLKTTRGYERVDVIYRRIDDAFLDPEAFNPASLLGVPGLMRCFRKGNVALANAPGAGIADDKAIYTYVPDMIRYYLDQDPIIPNVPTYLCSEESQRDHVLCHLDKYVVKPSAGSGGYGLLIGPQASKAQRELFKEKILAQPRDYIAQPTVQLSRNPTMVDSGIEGRHVDLRPYVLTGPSTYVLPGGLTRVALVKDSLVVNSSQGGGSKDTWVMSE